MVAGARLPARRVGIVLPYLNDYRVPLLTALDDRLTTGGVELVVATGSPEGADVARNDRADGYPTSTLGTLRIPTPKGRLQIRRLGSDVLDSDLIIVEHAVKNLESHGLLYRPRPSRKVAIWGHGHTITKPLGSGARVLQRTMALRADWYFGYTAGSVQRAHVMGMPADRCTNVQNTVDTARLRQVRASHARRETSTWEALYVGGLDGTKRIDFLIEAAQKVHAEDPRFVLKVVGDGRERHKIEELAAEPWCDYLGSFPLADQFELVRDCRVILMPGRVGLAAVDSFALRTPLITTEWDWHAPEFEYLSVENSVVTENGLDAYVEGVLGLMRDPERLAGLQAQCETSADEFSIDNTARRYAEGIMAALDSSRRSRV